MSKSKIDWCDESWNPVTGCRHGCQYCYARDIVHRFGGEANGRIHELTKPERDARGHVSPYPFGFDPTFHEYRLGDYSGPRMIGRTIFVGSMADLFGDWVPDDWITRVFRACRNGPQHTYLFLTKNPARYARLKAAGLLPEDQNMFFGCTVTDEASFDRNMEAMRTGLHFVNNAFVSIEPLRGRIRMTEERTLRMNCCEWVILGAETGTHPDRVVPAREWVEEIVDARHNRHTHLPLFIKDNIATVWGTELIRERPGMAVYCTKDT